MMRRRARRAFLIRSGHAKQAQSHRTTGSASNELCRVERSCRGSAGARARRQGDHDPSERMDAALHPGRSPKEAAKQAAVSAYNTRRLLIGFAGDVPFNRARWSTAATVIAFVGHYFAIVGHHRRPQLFICFFALPARAIIAAMAIIAAHTSTRTVTVKRA
jgi:hypothetical protein